MLQVKEICKKYQTGSFIQQALDHVSLNLRDNEFVAILGPSGSGKTTLLNIIGGLDRYDSGDLIINGISTKKYKDRDWDSYRNHTIGFVFQSYNLIPHQTILSNVELALTISGVSKSERRQKAIDALTKVGLGQQIHKKPNQLSGGQMQRVAIARALVNDPDILLADEPTGALDSETSIQVMDLLKEVAKDRLVVMVTHNPELAKDYATRIVTLKDGVILDDTNPFIVEDNQIIKDEKMGKTSMSLLTSLSLSFNNLKTKKGRTFLTSFAGSIGIIGIALILSLSNGVNTYIQSIEEDTLSEYPLQITSTGVDMTSMMVDNSEKTKSTKDIQVANMLTTMFSKIGSNDLESLKSYIQNNEKELKQYSNSIEYTYNVAPQIYSYKNNSYRQVNPDKTFSSLGMSQSSNSTMSTMMSTDVFKSMPKNTSLFSNQYDVKAGHWPKKYNECVVVLTQTGKISDLMAYSLGLRDASELDKMINQLANDEEVSVELKSDEYNYEDILNTSFKLVNAADYYVYDSSYNVYKDQSNDENYMKDLINKGEDIKIVGIVQPKEGQNATMLPTGIYYPSSLIDHVIKEASNKEIVKKQNDNHQINIFTGKSFDEKTTSFDMSSLFSIDQNKMKSAFKINQDKLDLNNINLNLETLPPLDFNNIINQINIKITNEQLQQLTNALLEGYKEYETEHPEQSITNITEEFMQYLRADSTRELLEEEIRKYIGDGLTQEELQKIYTAIVDDYQNNVSGDITNINQYLINYIQSDKAQTIVSNEINKIMKDNDIEKQMSLIMSSYMKDVSTSMQKQLQVSMNDFSKSLANAFEFDSTAFTSAMKMNTDENGFMSLMSSMMTSSQDSYDNNIKKLGYADFNKPSGINIYPKDFESKEEVINFLDTYNNKMEKTNQDDKVITYTDLVGTLMSSVTDIINVISYVLVAFVGISLVVSSIMIGVITYISVLERKKEIGILRAIGASKRNISQVFNAETFIIGLLAGVIGIGFSLLSLIPANMLIHKIANTNAVSASLPAVAGIILIVLSVILTLIGGIIPSKKAAKEDPVTALRTD